MNRLLYYSLSLYLSISQASAFPEPAAPSASAQPSPCQVVSPKSSALFDLHKLNLVPPGQSKAHHPQEHSWNTTGQDYPYNFTMNICGPVIEELKDVEGVEKSLWKNVSAFYTLKGKTYSIGQQNNWPVLRGRKLVLNYTDGSPCDDGPSKRDDFEDSLFERATTKKPANGDKKGGGDDDDDDEEDDKKKPSKSRPDEKQSGRRKNTIISLLCDRDRDQLPAVSINFVGASPDQCSYFFEARSSYACAKVNEAKQTLGPAGVFGIIVLIAVLVYVVGGIVYSRMVLQQRGWRQCPNFGLWSGMFSFLGDLFVILTSSCARCLPSRRGYSRVNANINGSGRGRGRDSDAENRLIDELNEEWDD